MTEMTISLPEVDSDELRSYGKQMQGFPQTPQTAVSMRNNPNKSDGRSLYFRWSIIWLMKLHKMLNDWIHDGEVDDVVFRVVAKYPLNPVSPGQKDPFPLNDILESIKAAAGTA